MAVKVFRLDLPPESVVRLADALRHLAAIPAPHPALAQIFDAGIEGTSPFLVTNHLSGQTLDVWLRRRAPMPFDAAMPVLRSLADVVDAASDAGLRHGALHPRDVFISDDDRFAGVTGFGVVDALTAAGIDHAPMRRPYVAPERSSASWDLRADVYSLGVITHEMFTGRRPAGGGEQDGVFARELSPEQRVRLRRVLAQALSDAPERRFDCAAAFLDVLEDTSRRPGRKTVPRGVALAAMDARTPTADAEAAGRSSESDILEPGPDSALPAPPAPDVQSHHETAAGEIALGEPDDARASRADAEIGLDGMGMPASAPFVVAASVAARQPFVRRTWPMTGAMAAAGLVIGIIGGVLVIGTWSDHSDPTAPAANGATADAEAPADAADAEDEVVPARTEPTRASADPAATSGEGDARPAIASPGRLVVRSTPSGALVTIGGRLLGETPVVVRDLPLGSHDVQVAHPGHVPHTERVTLAASSPVRTLSVTLQPGLPPVAATRGSIDVDSRPRGARVLIDGRFVGHAPLRVADVGAGEHQITLELGGYHPATGRVQVEPGRAQAVRLTLRAAQ